MCYPYTLHDLLCLHIFSQRNAFICEGITKKIITWAEGQVVQGNQSESLLILASLGLDIIPERHEFEQYLSRFLSEQQISLPPQKTAALIWLKIFLWELAESDSKKDVELRLYFLVGHWFVPEMAFFIAATDTLKSVYWHLFDEWYGEGTSDAVTLPEAEFFALVKNSLIPYYRKLNNSDWMSILSR